MLKLKLKLPQRGVIKGRMAKLWSDLWWYDPGLGLASIVIFPSAIMLALASLVSQVIAKMAS